MPEKKPYYRLESRYSDGSQSSPEAFHELSEIDGSWQATRRSMVKGLLQLAAICGGAALLNGCGPSRQELLRRQRAIEQENFRRQAIARENERRRKEAEDREHERKWREFQNKIAREKDAAEKKRLKEEAEKFEKEKAEKNKKENEEAEKRRLADIEEEKANKDKEVKVKILDNQTGTYTTRTLPCGSPIPPGAICTCNCVPVTRAAPSAPSTYRTCRCVPVCTCNKICTCIPIV
jgi:hypothetical protein